MRATRYRSELASAVRWAVVFVFLVCLFALLGVLNTKEPSNNVAPLLRYLWNAVRLPGVPVALGIALLALMAWTFRHIRLAWLVWHPGRILVPDFVAGSDLGDVNPAQLTAVFRHRLVSLRLESAAPSPGASPAGPVFDVSTGAASDVLDVLLRLVRIGSPSHALEIHGVVRHKSGGSKPCGVTLQVLHPSVQATPVVEVWESSWEVALERAADDATAAILPRTRLCRGPWASWRGYVMPPGLLTAYEKAAELEQQRRFDEALRQYWVALRLDPMNLTMRLRLAQLHEKAGLFLAALTNYVRVIAVSRPGSRDLPRGLYHRAARREWDRAVELAKYRAIVLLAGGTIVRQWNQTDDERRSKLHQEFIRLLKPLAETERHDPAADAISEAIKQLLAATGHLDADQARKLAKELAGWAYSAAEELKLSLSWLESRPTSRPLTRRTVALAQACIERRVGLLLDDLVLRDRTLKRLKREVRHAGMWPSRVRRWQWHEHYNAACVYAIPLDKDKLLGDRRAEPTDPGEAQALQEVRNRLAHRAIRRLERAITTRDGIFLATWRDWVVVDDPDLDGLRGEDIFAALVSMYFTRRDPAPGKVPKSPSDPYRLAECRYTLELMRTIGRTLHDIWHGRSKMRRSADIHLLARWCDDDRDIWELLRNVAEDSYDWRTRYQLLERANKALDGQPPIFVHFRGYDDQNLVPDGQDHHPEQDADGERKENKERLKALAELLRDPTNFHWMPTYDAHPRAPLLRSQVIALCEEQAAVWQTFSEWMRVGEPTSTHAEFARTLKNASELWHATLNGGSSPAT